MFNGNFQINKLQTLLSKRDLETKGKVQWHIDNAVLKYSDPYVPLDTGELKGSGTRHTILGSGQVVYKTPYARKLYYSRGYTFNRGKLRGQKWFERMKQTHKKDILRIAIEVAGAE